MDSKDMAIQALQTGEDVVQALVYANEALGEWKRLAVDLFDVASKSINTPDGSLVPEAKDMLMRAMLDAIERLGTIKE